LTVGGYGGGENDIQFIVILGNVFYSLYRGSYSVVYIITRYAGLGIHFQDVQSESPMDSVKGVQIVPRGPNPDLALISLFVIIMYRYTGIPLFTEVIGSLR